MSTEVSVPTNATGSPSSLGMAAAEAAAPAEQAAPIAEQPPEAPKTAEEERLHRQIMAMTRKERELQKMEARIKQEAAAHGTTKKEYEEYLSLKEQAKTNPLAFAKHFNLELKSLINQTLNDERPTTEMTLQALQDEVQRLKDEKSKERQLSERKQAEALVDRTQNEIKQFIDAQGETYELIREFGAYEKVFERAYEVWQQTGETPPIQQIADEMEAGFLAEAQKLLRLKKLTPKQAEAVQEIVDAKADAAKPGSGKTLTNSMTPATAPQQSRLLPREQSLAEAAKLIRWT